MAASPATSFTAPPLEQRYPLGPTQWENLRPINLEKHKIDPTLTSDAESFQGTDSQTGQPASAPIAQKSVSLESFRYADMPAQIRKTPDNNYSILPWTSRPTAVLRVHRNQGYYICIEDWVLSGGLIFDQEDVEDPTGQQEASDTLNLPVDSLVERAGVAIDELAGLAPGWDGYDGLPVRPRVAEHALRFLQAVGDETRIVPDVVPLSDGGLQLEWYVGACALEVSIDPDCNIEAYFESKHDGRLKEISIDANLDVSQLAPLLRKLRR